MIKKTKATIRVCHVITGLGAGGAERMLVRLVGTPHESNVEHSVISLMDEGVFGPEIREKGCRLHTLGMLPNRPPLIAFFRLVKILKSENPDVLMTWLYHADLLGTIASWFSRVQIVYWNLRCSDMTQENEPLLSTILLKVLALFSRLPTGIVTNSIAGLRHHKAIGYRPKQWTYISNGVDLDQFYPNKGAGHALRRKLDVPPGGILIGHIARFHPMKDHETLLKATAQVIDYEKNAYLVLIGRGVSKNNQILSKLIEQNNIKDRVRLLGDQRNMPQIFSGLDLVVMSSAFGEGSPNAITEAMACGIPCVVTNVGDAAAIVGETGIVVPHSNPERLSEGILQMVQNFKTNGETLGKAAEERIKELYDIETVVDRYQLLFNEGH